MPVKKSRVRDSFAVAADGFAWDPCAIAVARHSTLPWYELPFGASYDAVPLADMVASGERERLSLLAQFAAHCAFLQFAGIADGEFDPSEWVVSRRRGTDARLIRTSARAREEAESPLSSIVAFANAVKCGHLPLLHRAWARPESLYRELFLMLTGEIAADFRWLRLAATGVLLAPGATGLRAALASENGSFRASEGALRPVRMLAALDARVTVIAPEKSSPLVPFSALGDIGVDTEASAAVIAEQLASRVAGRTCIVSIADEESIDAGSRQVLEILRQLVPAIAISSNSGEALPETQVFVVAPRLAALAAIQERTSFETDREAWLREFVQQSAFEAFIKDGVVPAPAIRAIGEPKRSWLAALALLGRQVERSLATRFLEEFFFGGALEELVVDGITTLDGKTLSFISEPIRASAAAHIPEASRAALCRKAARMTTGVRAALLHLEGGEGERAAEILERSEGGSSTEIVTICSRLGADVITPRLRQTLAHALVDEGRYSDALAYAAALDGDAREFVIARAERRRGDYDAALARVSNLEQGTAATQALRAELLRVTGHLNEARDAASLDVDDDSERLLFQRVLVDVDSGKPVTQLPRDPYLAARIEGYRALQDGDFASAAEAAARAELVASTPIDRIDASLDRIFALFSSGRWDETRRAAVEALAAIDETQGDRAAGLVVFVLAFLAADDGQWSHAESRLRRLRDVYVKDSRSAAELELIEAQLAFARGRFDGAESHARAVLANEGVVPQIREAAALVLDEIDWIRGGSASLRSTGSSGNAELTRRRDAILANRAESGDRTDGMLASARSRAERLAVFRYAVARGRDDVATRLAQELGCEFAPVRDRAGIDARTLRAAATAPYPFAPTALPVAWRVAAKNRLGRWSQSGSLPPLPPDELEKQVSTAEWMRAGHEYVYIEGAASWPSESRHAVSALFAMRAENERLKRIIEQHDSSSSRQQETRSFEGMVGSSPAMRAVQDRIARVAARDVVVLVLGESGTGKELVANAVHRLSSRRSRTFTAVNCAALPDNLIESELFGHARGAFTGADRDRAGLIETTDGGTLFLDEIGEMALPAQAKLLRFLQESEFRRVGETVTRTADVRIVCATNRDLEQRVAEGTFRQDLFYRIHGVDIALPPLRERGTDILELAFRFLETERRNHGSGPLRLSGEVEEIFLSHRWPGNIRELQLAIRGAHALAGDAEELRPEHLPGGLKKASARRSVVGSYQDEVSRFRRELIERSLEQAGGNQNRAAAALRISRQALSYQIRELGIRVRRRRTDV